MRKLALKNFKQHISENLYPGRGIILGRNQDDSWILVYWIMGRSDNSRNRIFKLENGILRVEPANHLFKQNKKFLFYNVMLDFNDKIVITNGNHTDTIFEGLQNGKNFFSSLKSEKHESDKPNYTPRISGLVELSKSRISFAKICKSDFNSEDSSYHFYHYTFIPAGYGYCLTTYMSDGEPPPSFIGDPIILPLDGNAEEIANKYWTELDSENRISLFVRELIKSGKERLKIINRYGETN
tara:strand:- start:76 stop:795 length:720 start_codon:yes stop_codon:yes gene_type:complete